MKINRYKLRDDITKEYLEDLPYYKKGEAIWIAKDLVGYIPKCIMYKDLEVDVDIGFKEDIHDWNDFDNIIALDDDFGQLYTPFYKEEYFDKGEEITNFHYLEEFVKRYNKYMDSLPFLERVR